jgi:hypothetical protein
MLPKGKDSDVPVTKSQSWFSSPERVNLGNDEKDWYFYFLS